MLEEKCKKSVLGVVPYCNVDIEDEDSLSERFATKKTTGLLNIYVIRLPKISNFTDFGPLEVLSEVNLKYVTRVDEIKNPDLILIPGTKNTIADLRWLRECGLEALIKKYAACGCPVMGICGGYQMLGRKITDEAGVEGGGSVDGMGLLDVETCFGEEKHTIWSEGKVTPEGFLVKISEMSVKGYEIHMGNTNYGKDAISFLIKENGERDGCICENVFGTYFHGIFENDRFRNFLIHALCEKKGISQVETVMDYASYKEEQFTILADVLRKSLNMEAIYDIL